MRRCRNLAVMLGLLAVGLLVESCSHANQPPPQAAAAPILPSPPVSTARIPLPPLAHDPALITNERGILAAQRALTELGYNSGEADGVIGPATRRAIQAFQKDHALAEDGRWRPRYDPGIAVNFRDAIAADIDLRPYWKLVHGPVLVVRGEQSDLLLAETLEEMRQRPHTETYVVPRTGHAPMLMDDAQVGAVRHFLLT